MGKKSINVLFGGGRDSFLSDAKTPHRTHMDSPVRIMIFVFGSHSFCYFDPWNPHESSEVHIPKWGSSS